MRDNNAATKAEATAKKLATKQKEQAMQQHRLQLAEAALTTRGKLASTQPVVMNYRPKDCRRDVTLKHQMCRVCKLGVEGGKWLAICDFCNLGCHETCDTLSLLVHRHWKLELWVCSACKLTQTEVGKVNALACEYLAAEHNLDAQSAPRAGPAEGQRNKRPSPDMNGGAESTPSRPGIGTPRYHCSTRTTASSVEGTEHQDKNPEELDWNIVLVLLLPLGD
jgi:hypothetical protein